MSDRGVLTLPASLCHHRAGGRARVRVFDHVIGGVPGVPLGRAAPSQSAAASAASPWVTVSTGSRQEALSGANFV